MGWSVAIFLLILPVSNYAVTSEDHVNLLIRQAETYSKNGNHSSAMAAIHKAIKLSPNRPDLIYMRAFIIGRAGQYGQAIKEFSRFVKNEDFPHAVRFRADCYMAINQIPNAVNDYTVFLRRAPKDGKVWSYLVEALALMGKQTEALDALNRGLATRSHWSDRLLELQKQILSGQPIIPHKPLSN
jgi:tetratricopeptide (TPR) repeat protein